MEFYTGFEPEIFPPVNKRPKQNGRIPEDEVVILKEKVIVPVDKHPGYNFVGALLGPSGSFLKELQKNTKSRMAILGKGSMKDKKKEEELSASEEDEHAHLKEPLHVLIDIKAPRSEAHRRMSEALLEVYKFMVPPEDDVIEQHQYNAGPFDGYAGNFGFNNGDIGLFRGFSQTFDPMKPARGGQQHGRGGQRGRARQVVGRRGQRGARSRGGR